MSSGSGRVNCIVPVAVEAMPIEAHGGHLCVRHGDPAGIATRMVHHTFATLRARLGWIGRGNYALPRVHDLRQHAGFRIMPGCHVA